MIKLADNDKELLEVFDENWHDKGVCYPRKYVHEHNLFHLEISLWIINKKEKEVLLERRSYNKRDDPGKLSVCEGHVTKGFSVLESAIKEAHEELGISLNEEEIKPFISFKNIRDGNYSYRYCFYVLKDIPLENYKIQKEEVEEVMYMNFYDYKRMIESSDERVSTKYNENIKRMLEEVQKVIEG